MGYAYLRSDLHRRKISLRMVAQETGIDLTLLYKVTSRDIITKDLTKKDKQRIYNLYYADSKLSFEEVFRRYEDTEPDWHREVFSSTLRGRRR